MADRTFTMARKSLPASVKLGAYREQETGRNTEILLENDDIAIALRHSRENVAMSKEVTGFKYSMVDLLTGATMSLMYLNVLAAANLLFLSVPWQFMKEWMKGLEGGTVATLEQREPLSHNRQIGHIPRKGSLTRRTNNAFQR